MRKTLVFRGLPEIEKAEGADTWENVQKFLLKFLALYDPEFAHLSIDRAYRSARKIDPCKSKNPRPRPVFAEFVSWQDASRVLTMIAKIGKTPYKFEDIAYNMSVEQMVSKSVMEKRQTALKVRKFLMNENPNWLVSLHFPAILMVKKSREKQYRKYSIKDDVIKKANEFIDSLILYLSCLNESCQTNPWVLWGSWVWFGALNGLGALGVVVGDSGMHGWSGVGGQFLGCAAGGFGIL